MRNLSAWSLLVLATAVFAGGDEGERKPAKPKLPKAPAFTLTDFLGKKHSLKDYRGKWVVLEWINHDCPFVKARYRAGVFPQLQKKYTGKGVVWLSICSSAPGKQGHFTPERWKELHKQKGSAATAVLLDPKGKVGMSYSAKTTPHMFVINGQGEIVYQGAIDDNPRARTPEQLKSANNYVAQALDAVLAGKEPPVARTRPFGCSVKYP
ncbi:MAG: thioredoxin family protein [Planctomycetota bacterium]|jgi:peroxiredoxin